ncbi:RIP metalloprotease RseP [Aquimarina agarivorans]|uniref:RIP metalloprotease RseP n=1 Tax=Aquimarina agarivorans TaxID=980584 RepID=UPI000498231C|nr:RIP metalloprotease RseP [Aquimarina agarivorans]
MELLFRIGQVILMLSILVILHEFGHYTPAKLFKIKVEKFFLFFDAKFALFQKKIGETVWGIGWLPLGGYVKIAGMIDESMDREQMALPPKPWEFRSKPAWQRLIVMAGGVIVNFLLAWLVFTCLLVSNGDSYVPTEKLKYGIEVNEIGAALGFKNGDKILSVDGKSVKKMNAAVLEIILGEQVTVLRDGKKEQISISDENKELLFSNLQSPFITARYKTILGFIGKNTIAEAIGLQVGDIITKANDKPAVYWSEFANQIKASSGDTLKINYTRNNQALTTKVFIPKDSILGVSPERMDLIITDKHSIASAIPAGFNKTIQSLTDQVRQFKVILNKKTGAYKQVKGPIGLVEQMPNTWNNTYFWTILATLSVWLAFVNLLPIPALDGGHIMFLLYEIISGRKPSQRVLEMGQMIGFFIILTLMVFIFGNDIWNLLKG